MALYRQMKYNYTIRHATEADIAQIMAMYDHSRTLMRAAGNTVQWTGYPTREDVVDDIRRHASYIIHHSTFAAGTFALVPGDEPTYNRIDHGSWITPDAPYSTLHRLAKTAEVNGVADTAFAFAKSNSDYLRVDTHASNAAMRRILEREGFVPSGTVYMADGSPRLAYEWWRWDMLPEGLKGWVESAVLPRYEAFDAAHRAGHARRVVARAMAMAATLWPMAGGQPAEAATMHAVVYTAAAMHDLGLACGRERHHLESGRMVRECRELRRWFDDGQIELIAQAAEDHRASATAPPRSQVGCIVAEADRDVEPESIVRRTVEYGLGHYPELDREGHWQRTLQHLHEKYAEGGYLKLWFEPSPNAAPLAELRTLIADEGRLRQLFDSIMEQKL